MKLKYKVVSKLNDYIGSKGIKKVWIAEQLGTTRQQIQIWSKNNDEGFCPSPPSLPYAIRLIDVLDCELTDLFEVIELDE
ncbi:helix-turn-helix domain-containing protein [Bacillus licheniformis]|uniref:helix-turn-helix domain-containing protein n=1 Tax=Bacillus licheniformis TaxID=1402 RepID=UPI0021BDC434|nr:helix-turn-helix transcriptional regulator [Bacillus licheniformis]